MIIKPSFKSNIIKQRDSSELLVNPNQGQGHNGVVFKFFTLSTFTMGLLYINLYCADGYLSYTDEAYVSTLVVCNVYPHQYRTQISVLDRL